MTDRGHTSYLVGSVTLAAVTLYESETHMWEKKKCKACGEELDWRKRSHADYCNANCRKRANRRKQIPQQVAFKIIDEMQQFMIVFKQDPALAPDIAERLRRIQGECRDMLARCDPQYAKEHGELLQMFSDRDNQRARRGL